MNIAVKQANLFLGSREFTILGTIASIASLVWALYDQISLGSVGLGPKMAILITLTSFGAAFLYSFLIRAENRALRDIAAYFGEVNEIYRDTLRELFGCDEPVANAHDLLVREEEVLTSVCQRIEKIYSRIMFGRPCMVTVKLVITEDNGKCFAHTYVRNETHCARDNPEKIQYEVGTGENTAFDEAVKKRPDGKPPHFYSANLAKDAKQDRYRNQRQGYLRFYKSAIVVPIRGQDKNMAGTDQEFDHVGYLCLDTLSVNWLNDNYHLYIMTALANQMYNFISLMRGKYTVSVSNA